MLPLSIPRNAHACTSSCTVEVLPLVQDHGRIRRLGLRDKIQTMRTKPADGDERIACTNRAGVLRQASDRKVGGDAGNIR
jgi:hypothetical protein